MIDATDDERAAIAGRAPVPADQVPVRFVRADGSSFFKLLDASDARSMSVYTLRAYPPRAVDFARANDLAYMASADVRGTEHHFLRVTLRYPWRTYGPFESHAELFPPTPKPSDVDPYTGMTYAERIYHAHGSRRVALPPPNPGAVGVYLYAEGGEQNVYFDRLRNVFGTSY